MVDHSSGSALSRWRLEAIADGAEPAKLRAPLYVLYEEAIELSRFHARYWKVERDAEGRLLRRGLEQAVGAKMLRKELSEETGAEIESLLDAVQQAHVAYLLRSEPLPKSPAERGRFVLSEMTAVLEWLFEDGIDEDEHKHGRAATARDEEPETVEGLASALEDYAQLADAYRDAIDGVGGFDAGLIDEAREIAEELRAREFPATPSPEAAAALALRGKLITLLLVRMQLVRAAARFVFRGEPEILRAATSAYERKGRAAARRAAARRAGMHRVAVTDASTVERSTAV